MGHAGQALNELTFLVTWNQKKEIYETDSYLPGYV